MTNIQTFNDPTFGKATRLNDGGIGDEIDVRLRAFGTSSAMIASDAVLIGDLVKVSGRGEYAIVAAGTYTASPTVIDLTGIAGQAVSTSLTQDCTFAEDTRTIAFLRSVYGSSDTVLAKYKNAEHEIDLAQAASIDMTTAGGVKLGLIGPWRSASFGGDAAAFAAAVRARSTDLVAGGTLLEVLTGENVRISCDPSAISIKDYVAYMSLAHSVQGEGTLALEIADGLHNVSTVIDVDNGAKVSVVPTAAPDEFDIASMTYADQGGGVWRATVVIASGTLPSYLAAGTVVGVQNPVGNGTPDAAAGGLRVFTRNSATSLTVEFQSRGVVPLVNMTTPTAGVSLGITQNKLIVPKCCIRADSAGWTAGGAGFEEGFINARNGAVITLDGIGLSYNGTADGHEMVFARDTGSTIKMIGKSVLVGDCSNITRGAYGGTVDLFGSFIGLGITGQSVWQGVADCAFFGVRTMFSGGTAEMISATATCAAFFSQCVLSGGLVSLKTTYPSAFIDVATSRIRHCGAAAQPTRGTIYLSSDTSLEYCTTPFVLTGSNFGKVVGNPALANNTNTPTTANAIQANGAVWVIESGRTYNPEFQHVGKFAGVLDFPSIAANSFEDLTITATGAAFSDFCIVQRSGSAEPAQGIVFRAFVSAAGVITVRAYNVTAGAINPTAFTGLVLVLRAT